MPHHLTTGRSWFCRLENVNRNKTAADRCYSSGLRRFHVMDSESVSHLLKACPVYGWDSKQAPVEDARFFLLPPVRPRCS